MRTDTYRLVQLASGVQSIHAVEYGETFHPVIGPVAEAEALYVRQLELPERRRQTAGEFVLWDVGLGAAANVLTVLRSMRHLGGVVRVVSFDYTIAPLQFALQHAGALGYLTGYEQPLGELVNERQATFLDEAQTVHWSLHQADFPSLLETSVASQFPKPHAILFDAFSPARNPAMWTGQLFAKLYRLLDPGRPCSLATYSRSTMLRVSMLLAGFHVGAGHATGEKEETTIAANTLDLVSSPLGADWLRRAQNSTSAEPLWEPSYRQARLSPETWERLQKHPQFGGIDFPFANGKSGRHP